MNVEYDIHGWLGLRLVDPPPKLAKLVARQMDPLTPSTLSREPDVSLIAEGDYRSRSLSYRLGDAGDRQECAFGDGLFCFLNEGGALCVPFDSVGSSCEIRYAPGLNLKRMFLTYVRPIFQLSLLGKGAVAVHSAAALHKGKGILFAGWSESGKTEAMLAFLHQGASFISDKWTILVADGSAICNFPTPITARWWLLSRIAELNKNLTLPERLRVRLATPAAAIAGDAGRSSRSKQVRRLGRVAAPILNMGSAASVTSSRLFCGGRSAEGADSQSLVAPLTKVFLLISSNNRQIQVRPASSSEVIQRLADCALYERRGVLASYTKFCYAFPDRRNPLIDECRQREVGMLTKAFAGKEIYIVETPFPFDPLRFYDAVSPFC